MSNAQVDQELSRRGFLDWAIRLCGGITGVGLLGPTLLYVWPSTQEGPVQHRQEVGAEQDWAVWTGKKVAIGGKAVVVVRMKQGFRAFSAVCPHLGCLVHWDQAKRLFECPCHAAFFDQDGKVASGPPPRPLRELMVSVVQGQVFVST